MEILWDFTWHDMCHVMRQTDERFCILFQHRKKKTNNNWTIPWFDCVSFDIFFFSIVFIHTKNPRQIKCTLTHTHKLSKQFLFTFGIITISIFNSYKIFLHFYLTTTTTTIFNINKNLLALVTEKSYLWSSF